MVVLTAVAARSGGGRGGFGGGGGGPRGGGGGGVDAAALADSAAEIPGKRYNVTLTVSARNAFNHVNLAPPSGILTSPFFGESTALAAAAEPVSAVATTPRPATGRSRSSCASSSEPVPKSLATLVMLRYRPGLPVAPRVHAVGGRHRARRPFASPPDRVGHDLGSSFKSMLGTLNHVYLAEWVWLRRVQGQPGADHGRRKPGGPERAWAGMARAASDVDRLVACPFE